MAKMTKRDRPRDIRKTVRQLSGYIGRHTFLLFLVAFLVAVSAAANIAGIYMIRPVINRYVLPGDRQGLLHGVLLTAAIFAAGALSALGYVRTMVHLAQKIVAEIRSDLFRVLQTLPIRFYDTHRHGELMSLFTNDVDIVSEALNNSFAASIQYFIQIIGTLLVLVILSPQLSVIVLAGYFLMYLWISYSGRKSKFYFDEQQKGLGVLNGFIEETVGGQKVVKVFRHEAANLDGFRERNRRLQEAGTRAQRYASTQVPMVMALSYINYAVVAAAGGILTMNGRMDVGALASYLVFVRQAAMPINRFTSQANVILNGLAGAERIFAVMNEAPETDRGTVVRERGENGGWVWKDKSRPDLGGRPVRGDIRFEHVTFGYVPEHPVLNDICLSVSTGQKIAFVGSTGAGKTTITNLLNRFYEVDAGRIVWDGTDIRSIAKESLRQCLAMVLQDTHLFTGSIAENIRFGKPEADDREIEAAAAVANADGFIRRLPDGYRTVITGDGDNLSQGQRQLIAIARAAVADPSVLILDEATSSVDTRTEALIEKAMDRLMKGRTVFVIAHRLSTVRNADRIVVLEHGRVVEQGSHEELLKRGGEYYKLYSGMSELS